MRRASGMDARLSRRRFLAGTGGGFIGLLAACSGPDDRHVDDPYGLVTPDPETSRSESGALAQLPDAVAAVTATTLPPAEQLATVTAEVPLPTGEAANTGTSVATRAPRQVTIDYIPVVSRRLQLREISLDALYKIWNGEISDWSELGEPGDHPIKRVSVAGSAGPLSLDKADVNVAKLDDLEEFLFFETGAIALLPRQQVNFRFRHLRMDGVDHLVNRDSANPLTTTVTLDPRSPLQFGQLHSAVNDPTPISMTWLGDIIFGRFVHIRLEEIGDFSASFWDIHPELTWADFTIGNLECTLSDNYPQPEDPQTFSFKTWTAAVEGLKLAQIDVLGRANNHSFNFGIGGMDDTTKVLNDAGILHFGMGHNLDEARRAVVVEKHGVTYALLGYNGISDDYDGAGSERAGTMPMEPQYVIEDIARELAAGHVVIPFFHWGVEYVSDPTDEQRSFAQLAIDRGAAMVMGSHPHWVQAVETYRGKPIVYSLGNFIFDQAWSVETTQGMISHVWMEGANVLSVDLVPIVIQNQHRPRIMDRFEAVPVLDRVWEASERIILNG